MARKPREFGVGIYHVAAHGSDRRHLFLDDDDRLDFLDRLSATFWAHAIDLLAYALLGNHYHALARIPGPRLSDALQRLHTEYSRHHNRRHRRSAHLFRAHCLARRLNDDADLITAYRYLAHNPVNAGLAPTPLDWRWASTRAHAGLEPAAIALDERPLRELFGPAATWRHRYAEFILDHEPPLAPDPGRRGRSKEGEPTVPPLGRA